MSKLIRKPRIKKSGCFWIVLVFQPPNTYWAGHWTYEACHETIEQALAFAKRVYFS